jgi:hypothetical protein
MLFEFLLGFFALNSILLLWFYSPLKLSLAKIIFKEDIFEHDKFEELILIRWRSLNLATLSSCYICFSFWTSLIIGFILMFLFNLPWYTPIVTFLCYPSLAYAFKKIFFENKVDLLKK